MVEQPITPPSALSLRAAAMAPPVSRETYHTDMVALREQIMNLESAGNIEDAVTRGTPLHKAIAKIAEKILMSISSLEDKTATLEGTSTSSHRENHSTGNASREET